MLAYPTRSESEEIRKINSEGWSLVYVPNSYPRRFSWKLSQYLSETYASKNVWGVIRRISETEVEIYNKRDAMMYVVHPTALSPI